MHAVVITFDRLPVQYLACYGNSWIETPHFDRLAGRSVVFDQHFASNVDPALPGRAWNEPGSALLTELKARGVPAELLREKGADPQVVPTAGFHAVREFAGEEGLDAAPKKTAVAATVDAALDSLRGGESNDQGLLWVHLRGVPVPWLAPRDYATLYLELVDDEEGTVVDDAENAEEHADVEEIDFEEIGMDEDDEESDEAQREDDEPLVDFSREEFRRFLSEHATFPRSTEERIALSPADRRIIRSLYGGYVTYLDRELGRIIDTVDQLPENKPLLIIVAAARGEALDDVTALDADGKQLADDIVHTPLFVWDVAPSRSDIGSRRQALVQTDDLVPTIAEWFGITNEKPSGNGQSLLPLVRNEKLELRSEIVLSAPGATAIRTREYYLVHSESPKPVNEPMLADAPAAQLFLKPEDIWEVNDVAGQSPGLVESLLDRLKSRTSGVESPQGTT